MWPSVLARPLAVLVHLACRDVRDARPTGSVGGSSTTSAEPAKHRVGPFASAMVGARETVSESPSVFAMGPSKRKQGKTVLDLDVLAASGRSGGGSKLGAGHGAGVLSERLDRETRTLNAAPNNEELATLQAYM